MTPSHDHGHPPRWAERLLRRVLDARDRDTISGDLLEEYREFVLPQRGRLRARLWYVAQVLSFVDGVWLGIGLGLVFGAWNVIVSVVAPLMDDTPLTLLSFYGPMSAAWGYAGHAAYRRTRRLGRAMSAGAIVALTTFSILTIVVIVRMNLSLALMSERPDWRNIAAAYQRSGFDSFRAYANYIYVVGTPFKLAIASTIGALSGFIGGLVALGTFPADSPRIP